MASKGVAPKVPVALPKGSEGPGGASAGAAPSNALVSVDNALSGAIGARIQVTTTTSTVEGTLYTADPLTSLLILNTSPASSSSAANITSTSLSAPSGAYRIIPLSQIQSFQLLSSPPSSTADISPQQQQLDTPALQHRLTTALGSARTTLARQGPKGTPPHAQALYDALARTHPARWEGTSMVISDCFVVEKPYLVSSVGYYGDGDKQQNGAKGPGAAGFKGDLERFRKVVEMEIEKASLRLGGGVSGMRATVVETRKGG